MGGRQTAWSAMRERLLAFPGALLPRPRMFATRTAWPTARRVGGSSFLQPFRDTIACAASVVALAEALQAERILQSFFDGARRTGWSNRMNKQRTHTKAN